MYVRYFIRENCSSLSVGHYELCRDDIGKSPMISRHNVSVPPLGNGGYVRNLDVLWLPCQKIQFYKNVACHGGKFSSFYIFLVQLCRDKFDEQPLSPEIQLLAALSFYAVGSFLEVVGDGYSMGSTKTFIIHMNTII